MLLLDSWNDPELALDLARCLSSQSTIVVATRSSAVAASLAAGSDGLITVDGYTPGEATTYFQRFCDLHQRVITPADREYFATVCGLVRANPLGLRIALSHWLWRGWAAVIRQLTAQPPEQAGQTATDLYRPLRMAYDFLDPGLQRAVRQLSAVPLLETCDQATFAALWPQLDPAYVDLYLDVLATDAGLIAPLPEAAACWKIHGSVLNFARSLAAAQGEDYPHQKWISRALTSETYQAAYRQFRERSPKWTVRRWIELDRTARLRYHESVWRRSWYVLRRPAYVPEWAVAQAFAPNFSAEEYLVAQRLRAEEVRTHRLIQAVVLVSVAAVLLGLLVVGFGEVNPWFAVDWLPRYTIVLALIILLDIGLLFYIWLVGMSHKVSWLQWWLEIQGRRRPSNADANAGDASTDQ